MATENNGTVKISWALSLMTLIAASLIGTVIALWRAEYSATDARLDQVWTEIKSNEQQANTDHYRLAQAQAQITDLQNQHEKDQDRDTQQALQNQARFDADERSFDKLQDAVNVLSDAVAKLAANSTSRDRRR